MSGLGGAGGRSDDLLGQLARWAAADRTARAASERARTRSLIGQASSVATWDGLLVDLAEAGAEVAVTAGGLRMAGRVVGVGRDFAILERRPGRPALVHTGGITSLSPSSPDAPRHPGGRRPPPLGLTLAAALDALAGEETPVLIRSGPDASNGDLVACGEDVVTLRGNGPGRRPVYIPLAGITVVELR